MIELLVIHAKFLEPCLTPNNLSRRVSYYNNVHDFGY